MPAEGAAILVLKSMERAIRPDASILAELVGYGASCDAFHPVQPDERGEGASRAMRWALADAQNPGHSRLAATPDHYCLSSQRQPTHPLVHKVGKSLIPTPYAFSIYRPVSMAQTGLLLHDRS